MIRLPIGMFVPGAGVFADGQARVVAENIAAEIAGKPGAGSRVMASAASRWAMARVLTAPDISTEFPHLR
ncbi:MAG: hypothetical protein IT529_14595 [Burkholderiales bacterium]|nr:hypothetical protein [Burkholderiales bacterium]